MSAAISNYELLDPMHEHRQVLRFRDRMTLNFPSYQELIRTVSLAALKQSIICNGRAVISAYNNDMRNHIVQWIRYYGEKARFRMVAEYLDRYKLKQSSIICLTNTEMDNVLKQGMLKIHPKDRAFIVDVCDEGYFDHANYQKIKIMLTQSERQRVELYQLSFVQK